MAKKYKQQEDAFKLIFKSFTYGKRLMRRKFTKADLQKLKLKEDLKHVKELEIKLLYILRNKKGKSIAGEVIGDKHEFVVENDVIDSENWETVDIKLVKYNSHKNFAYFRGEEDNMA